MRLLIASLLFCVPLAAQTNFRIQLSGNGPPTGSCNAARYTDEDSGLSYLCTDTTHIWVLSPVVPWRLQPGLMVVIISGICPVGFTEVTALNGKTLVGTLAANANVGTTGGLDNITPTGTNATVAFTPAGTVAAPTFTGTPFSGVINHTHTVTTTWNVQGGTTAATTGTHVMASTATGGSARAPTAGDVVSATTANPAGSVASITPAGTNSAPTFTGSSGTVPAPVFTGTQFDNRSAFVRVIFCSKN